MNPVLHNISTTGNAWFYRLLMWREKHIKEKNFVLFLALIVGIVCGFAALAFKWLIHYISSSLLLNIDITGGNYLYLVYPLIGILIVRLLCAICGARRHIAWCHQSAFCHIAE